MAKLETKIESLTSGPEDLTRASELSEAYQKSFDNGVGYSLKAPDGQSIVKEMAKNINDVFSQNIEALEVSPFLIFKAVQKKLFLLISLYLRRPFSHRFKAQ